MKSLVARSNSCLFNKLQKLLSPITIRTYSSVIKCNYQVAFYLILFSIISFQLFGKKTAYIVDHSLIPLHSLHHFFQKHHEESGRVLSARYDHWPNLCIQEEIDAAISILKSFDPSFVIRNNVLLKEDQALLLLSVAMGLHGEVILKLALDHVPPTLSKTMRGSSVLIWFSFISDMTSKMGFPLSPAEVKSSFEFLEQYCPKFLSSSIALEDILWSLTGDNCCHFNKFVITPEESCLKCEQRIQMHSSPTKVIAHGSTGPLPASKLALECKECKTTYGIGHLTDQSGAHIYPKGIHSPFTEASNVSYMDHNFYKWKPSLG